MSIELMNTASCGGYALGYDDAADVLETAEWEADFLRQSANFLREVHVTEADDGAVISAWMRYMAKVNPDTGAPPSLALLMLVTRLLQQYDAKVQARVRSLLPVLLGVVLLGVGGACDRPDPPRETPPPAAPAPPRDSVRYPVEWGVSCPPLRACASAY